jgi:TolB-like protein/class 3 adenylate cyclase/Flp pilus assembly protein TadD
VVEPKSQIATLLAADIADASRLSKGTEESRHALDVRREIFLRLVDEHGGRIGATTGEALVSVFPNPIDAVHCAVAIQRAVLTVNETQTPDERVLLRVGLNVGDVVETDGRLHGSGVDVAILLASFAVPGGICLANSVFEQVKHRVHVGVEFTGEKRVKGIQEPIPVYQVVEPGVELGYFSLWSELKRRNVFRVGTAYAVVNWVLVQAAAVILPTFSAPRWALQAWISVAVIGFPVALVMAWVYEITPMGLQRSDQVLRQASIRRITGRRLDRMIIGLLVVVVALLVFANYAPLDHAKEPGTQADSIAVLAFENRSANPQDQYFADGLADEILSRLGRVHELKVASRTASFYYKGKDIDVATIAQRLMVGHVLSGSVQRDGDRIRVTAAVDDAETGNLLWSESYDRRVDDILDIQSEIARSVAAAIVPVLSPQSRATIDAHPTQNVEAYDYYLRARDYLRQPAAETTLASARQLFERAIGLDPRFAQAYAGLCEVHLGGYQLTKAAASFEQAEVACHRALTLEGDLWEVHLALGNLYGTNGQYDTAIKELETAIDSQPNAVAPYLALANIYASQGRAERAEATYRRAEEVESGYWAVHNEFGKFLLNVGRSDEAIERFVKVTELVPDSGIGYDNLGNVYLAEGRLDDAIRAFDAAPERSRWLYTNRGLVHYFRGEFSEAVSDQLQAIALAPEYNAAWGRLADAYRFLPGEENKAADAYATAIARVSQELLVNPDDANNVGRLAVYYAYTGKLAEAHEQIAKMLTLATADDALASYLAARVSLRSGDTDAAYGYLQKAVASSWSPSLLANDPDFASLRGDARFAALVRLP